MERIKGHVEVGQLPPLGKVPEQMWATIIRPDRLGEPKDAMKNELVDIPEIKPDEVLVAVMAGGVNYNNVWASLGKPVSVFGMHGAPYHVAGSDASGVVYAVGSEVRNCKVGDHVVIHCNAERGPQNVAAKIWGYETPNGGFAQFTNVKGFQVMPKAKHHTWEEAASYALVLSTAWRMLISRAKLRPGETVLIWGGAGGLGVYACQICRLAGAKGVAVVSDDKKGQLAMDLGAVGYINRKEFPDMAWKANETPDQAKKRFDAMKAFGKKFMSVTGEKKGPDVVFEHSGAETFPASVFLCNRYGRVVICGATTGFHLTFDVRHLWMHQKDILGSHFASPEECLEANNLMVQDKLKPVIDQVVTFDKCPQVHQLMYENKLAGKATVLIGAKKAGETDVKLS
ncbi:MAG: crotonyl-CoA carboxylase/reductase [Candidatus Methylomirabilis sp.]|nr:crotonyl-CoA carboxylase/reductase [Deltaproteobacteria bacterium]